MTPPPFSHDANSKSTGFSLDFREIPLWKTPSGKWQPREEKYLDPDHQPKMPYIEVDGVRIREGLVVDDPRFVALDFDPKNNPDVYEDARKWLDPEDFDTSGQTTPHKGDHCFYILPDDLAGKIKSHEFPEVKGLDIKPGTKSYLATGLGYEWKAQEHLRPFPKKIADYYRDKINAAESSSASESSSTDSVSKSESPTHVTPQMYMSLAEPVQDYTPWLKQCDSLIAGGATLEHYCPRKVSRV